MADPQEQALIAQALRARQPAGADAYPDLQAPQRLDYSPEQQAAQSDDAQLMVNEFERQTLGGQRSSPYVASRSQELDHVRNGLVDQLRALRGEAAPDTLPSNQMVAKR